MKILITGISGALGRMVAARALENGHTVLGIDRRPWPDPPRKVEVFRQDIRKRPAEDVIRTHRPDAVVHLGTVTHLMASPEERYRINLQGTKAVFEYCDRYDVDQAIFVGRHTYYGANAESPLYHDESDPPLAISTFPELSDLIAADLYACAALWRVPKLTTAVLRFCYTLGSSRQGTLAAYLAPQRIFTVLGFDPLFQFMHELDAAFAIVLALERKLKGVYNVAGPQPVPLSLLIPVTGRIRIPLPEPLIHRVNGRFGLPWLPRGAVDYVKHPVVVSDRAFRKATGYSHTFDEVQTMESFRWYGREA